MDISALKNLGSHKLVPKVRILMLHCFFFHFIIVAYEYINIMNLKSMFSVVFLFWVYVKIIFSRNLKYLGKFSKRFSQ